MSSAAESQQKKAEASGDHSQQPLSPAEHLAPGEKYIEKVNPEDPEYIKQMQRPADVKEDMRQMEQRARVSLILNSDAFREELEAIVADQLKHGPHPASLIALQQISELLLPRNSRSHNMSSLGQGNVVVPINDIRGMDALNYAKGEKILRCKLAALYRLVDLFGWTYSIYNHVTARINQENEHFLINPFGLMYHEVTASSLVKIDMQGNMIDNGSTTYGINRAGFTLHSAIHASRPDIKCIIHLHTQSAVAISSMKCGFLPMSQEALIVGNVSYHEYNGIIVDEAERDSLARNLGPTNKVMFLRNHGLVACGETIEEAWFYAMNTMYACETQWHAMVAGVDNIIMPSEEARKKVQETVARGGGGVDSSSKKWKVGELEFEALMRCLDNAGYRTGYIYRQPVIRNIDRKAYNEVEVPPSASSFAYLDGDTSAQSPVRKAQEERKKTLKADWYNTPNVYVKTEIDEVGTPNPKKITKWVAESSPNKTSTPIKIETKNQFAPIGENPKELKVHQKQIKQDRFEDKITAGHQSKILDANWEDVQQRQTGTGKEQVIVVGAASKGIIRRDQQHNAVVFKTYYASNPFQDMGPEEVERYRKEVEQKQMRDQAMKKNSMLQELLDKSNGDKPDSYYEKGAADQAQKEKKASPVKPSPPQPAPATKSEVKAKSATLPATPKKGEEAAATAGRSDTMRSTSSGEQPDESPSKESGKKKKKSFSFLKKKKKSEKA